jgi:hypothetical protein
MRAALTEDEQNRLRRIATGRDEGEVLPEVGAPDRVYFVKTPDGSRAVQWWGGEWRLVQAVVPSSAME